MALKKYLVDLDLSKNQLLNAVVQNLAAAPTSPNEGQIYWDTADDTLYVWNEDGGTWIDLGASGTTNLTYTAAVGQGTVNSDTGTNAIIPLADATNAGLMTAAEKTKIANQSGTNTGDNATNSQYSGLVSNVDTDISINHNASTVDVESSDGNNGTIDAATTSLAGVMSGSDKTKLDGIAAGAQVNVAETVTSLGLAANILKYTDEDGTETDLDLSLYLDDTNLARLTSGALDAASGVATFTRDDSSTFTIDMSAFLDAITLNDTLVSTSTTEGLTAKQGKVLKDLIDGITDSDTQRTDAEIKSVIETVGYLEKTSFDSAAGTSTTITHTHGQYPTVRIFKTTSPFNEVEAQVVSTSATAVVVTFNSAVTAGEYKIQIQG